MKSNFSFPTNKAVPRSFLAEQTPAFRRIIKARHRKRARRFWRIEALRQYCEV